AEDDREMTRLAKLAEKQVATAVAVAERKKAEADTEALGPRKQQVILQARQKELDEKARQVDMARQEVQQAQIKTQEMKRDAEKARKEAEEKAMEAELARQKAEQLEREMADLKALKTERGIVLTLGDVLFESGRATLMPGAMRTIDKLSDFLKKNPKRNIVIEGHTDDVGGDEYNLNLSQRRADSLRDALLARGIGGARILTHGYGENYPVASNSTAAGRQQNRRVEIIILDEGVSGESVSRP
ncbi:MAG TPA: OmpA family protein, partial [Desulfosarcina sp.]|nr:OmpA family protein [Desulfosarcina sp.]